MRSRFLLFLAGVLMALNAGCVQHLPPAPPPRAILATQTPLSRGKLPMPDAENIVRVEGYITHIDDVNAAMQSMKIRIGTSRPPSPGSDLAVVMVNATTNVMQSQQGRQNHVAMNALAEGQHVQVAIGSLIKPAHPIQADAIAVTILE